MAIYNGLYDHQYWLKVVDEELYRYFRYIESLPFLEHKIYELRLRAEDGRRMVSIYDGIPVPSTNQFEERLTIEIAYYEARLEHIRRYIQLMNEIFVKAFAEEYPEKMQFVKAYWGSNMRKSRARKKVMQELGYSRSNFYYTRQDILTKVARQLGYID